MMDGGALGENQSKTLEVLRRVAAALVVEREVGTIVQLVVDAAREVTGAQFGAFFYNVVDGKGESYQLYALSGAPREAFAKFPQPRNTQIFGPTFNGEAAVRIADVLADPRYGHNAPYHGMPKGHLPVRSYLAVPVVSVSGEVLGGLFFGHSEVGVFGPDTEPPVVGLASQAAAAIDNARLLDRTKRDLVAARQGDQASRRLAAIVESSDDAIVAKDLTGIITDWNRAAERMFGYRAEEIVGKSILELIPPDLRPEEPQILARIVSGQKIDHFETVRRHKDGSLLNVSISVAPLRDKAGRIIGVSKIARDITAAKRAQADLEAAHRELAQVNRDLERRVHERTASLEEAVAQMEEFSYTVSHDLRAPLRAMQLYSDVLLEDYGEALPAEGKRCLERISENMRRLDRMALDVLTYSRVSRGALKLERVSLQRLVSDLLHLQPPPARVELGMLHDVIGHEPSLAQAISNLISNAVKFVPPGVTPDIKIWSETIGDRVRVWVEDNGIGIDPRYQERLFRMFERVHSDGHYDGTGVGLAIVRKAVTRMGGSVGVVSDGKTGSKFHIELRAA